MADLRDRLHTALDSTFAEAWRRRGNPHAWQGARNSNDTTWRAPAGRAHP